MTGHPAWGDPVNHPWTTGSQLAYNTEAVLWGGFIEQHVDELSGSDGKITVAALVMNNDFGAAYDGGLKAWLAQSSIKDSINYVTETIEPTAPTMTDPMTTLAAKNPDVFIADDGGTLVHPDHHRSRPERHEGIGEVPVPAVGVQEQRASSARTRSAVTARPPTAGGSSAAARRTFPRTGLRQRSLGRVGSRRADRGRCGLEESSPPR